MSTERRAVLTPFGKFPFHRIYRHVNECGWVVQTHEADTRLRCMGDMASCTFHIPLRSERWFYGNVANMLVGNYDFSFIEFPRHGGRARLCMDIDGEVGDDDLAAFAETCREVLSTNLEPRPEPQETMCVTCRSFVRTKWTAFREVHQAYADAVQHGMSFSEKVVTEADGTRLPGARLIFPFVFLEQRHASMIVAFMIHTHTQRTSDARWWDLVDVGIYGLGKSLRIVGSYKARCSSCTLCNDKGVELVGSCVCRACQGKKRHLWYKRYEPVAVVPEDHPRRDDVLLPWVNAHQVLGMLSLLSLRFGFVAPDEPGTSDAETIASGARLFSVERSWSSEVDVEISKRLSRVMGKGGGMGVGVGVSIPPAVHDRMVRWLSRQERSYQGVRIRDWTLRPSGKHHIFKVKFDMHFPRNPSGHAYCAIKAGWHRHASVYGIITIIRNEEGDHIHWTGVQFRCYCGKPSKPGGRPCSDPMSAVSIPFDHDLAAEIARIVSEQVTGAFRESAAAPGTYATPPRLARKLFERKEEAAQAGAGEGPSEPPAKRTRKVKRRIDEVSRDEAMDAAGRLVAAMISPQRDRLRAAPEILALMDRHEA